MTFTSKVTSETPLWTPFSISGRCHLNVINGWLVDDVLPPEKLAVEIDRCPPEGRKYEVHFHIIWTLAIIDCVSNWSMHINIWTNYVGCLFIRTYSIVDTIKLRLCIERYLSSYMYTHSLCLSYVFIWCLMYHNTGCWQSLLVMYWLLCLGCCFYINHIPMLFLSTDCPRCFRLSNWFSLKRLVPWMNHLPPT